MYSYNSSRSINSNFGELGFLPPWQVIVGLIQGAVYGGAAATKYSAVEKYLKKQKGTQAMSHAQQLEQKQAEIALKEQSAKTGEQTQLYADTRLKNLVIITFITLILVTVVGLGVYYYLAVEK